MKPTKQPAKRELAERRASMIELCPENRRMQVKSNKLCSAKSPDFEQSFSRCRLCFCPYLCPCRHPAGRHVAFVWEEALAY